MTVAKGEIKMRMVKVDEVVFYPIRPTEKGLIGFASCLFDGRLSLNSIAIYTRPDGKGYRLLFPLKRLPNSRDVNIFYPVNNETYELIKEAVVKKIEELAEKVKERGGYEEYGTL